MKKDLEIINIGDNNNNMKNSIKKFLIYIYICLMIANKINKHKNDNLI